MKLILTTDVPGLGAPGDIVEVRDGYGRNFLLPQGKAIVATKGAEKQVATIKRAQLAREIRGTEHANEVKQALENLGGKLTIIARTTGDGTKLFGSITAVDVADAIKAAGGPVARPPHHRHRRSHQDRRPAPCFGQAAPGRHRPADGQGRPDRLTAGTHDPSTTGPGDRPDGTAG